MDEEYGLGERRRFGFEGPAMSEGKRLPWEAFRAREV